VASNGLAPALEQRILVIDGAMGTMLQRHRLGEAEHRGRRFERHDRPLAGNYDLLTLTRPDVIADIHRAYLCRSPTSSKRIRSPTRIAQVTTASRTFVKR
jgi:methionine synthase I (cobalamin-dependent)